jgi:hypothetical protein
VKGASRAKSGIDGSPPKHCWDVFSDIGQRHDRVRVEFSGMREFLKCGEGFLVGEIKHAWMSLDDIEVEFSNLIEKSMVGSQVRLHTLFSAYRLANGDGGLCYVNQLLSIFVVYY